MPFLDKFMQKGLSCCLNILTMKVNTFGCILDQEKNMQFYSLRAEEVFLNHSVLLESEVINNIHR